MRKFLTILVALGLVAGVVYVAVGFSAGPAIHVAKPERFVGTSTPVELVVDTPGARLSSLVVAFEQNGTTTPLLSVGNGETAPLTPDGPDRVRVHLTVGRDRVPGLASGSGRIVVSASRPVLFGLRDVSSQAAHDITVRLDPPRVSVVSTHHYINLGGSEMIVYRVTPADVASGVVVGTIEYPGFPAAGLLVDGVTISDPAVRVAFFSLQYDQPLDTPMRLFARDEAGNTAAAEFDHRTFPKPSKQSRIPLDDKFLGRVVPAILAGTKEVAPTGSLIEQYVVINSELRRKNAETIASYAAKTAPEMLWRGTVFHPFTNNAVESAFADRRTYLYGAREVDRQVHLGFDLASVANAPVLAANRGRVLLASELGIYGNAVIIDHGLGVQSLYGHMSSIGVAPGAMVEKGQELGRTGTTGLAGGDHLHFTMLVNGRMVNPVEWWDAHWIEDRVLRKLK